MDTSFARSAGPEGTAPTVKHDAYGFPVEDYPVECTPHEMQGYLDWLRRYRARRPPHITRPPYRSPEPEVKGHE